MFLKGCVSLNMSLTLTLLFMVFYGSIYLWADPKLLKEVSKLCFIIIMTEVI